MAHSRSKIGMRGKMPHRRKTVHVFWARPGWMIIEQWLPVITALGRQQHTVVVFFDAIRVLRVMDPFSYSARVLRDINAVFQVSLGGNVALRSRNFLLLWLIANGIETLRRLDGLGKKGESGPEPNSAGFAGQSTQLRLIKLGFSGLELAEPSNRWLYCDTESFQTDFDRSFGDDFEKIFTMPHGLLGTAMSAQQMPRIEFSWVFTEEDAEYLKRKYNLAARRISVIHPPILDSQWLRVQRNRARELRKNPANMRILYLSRPASASEPYGHQEKRVILRDVARILSSRGNCSITFKLHPNESLLNFLRAWFPGALRYPWLRWRFARQNISALSDASDLVLTPFTGLVVVPASLGIPVAEVRFLPLQCDPTFDWDIAFNMGLTGRVSSGEELAEFINSHSSAEKSSRREAGSSIDAPFGGTKDSVASILTVLGL